jgi:hypothetical protein
MNVISFRALERSDFPLLQRWPSEPHVDAWWHGALDPAGLEQKYGPRIDDTEPTHVFIIEHESRPVGWIQWYRWSDWRGICSWERDWFKRNSGGITAIVTDPEERNVRSCRAFEKAGFIPVRTVEFEAENVRRCIMQLSLPSFVSQPLDSRC